MIEVKKLKENLSPPHNIALEQAILGSILINNKNFDQISDLLRSHHFHDSFHQKIYTYCESTISQGSFVDSKILSHHFRQDDQFLLNENYFHELQSNGLDIVHTRHYATLILDDFLKRSLIDIGQKIVYGASVEEDQVTALQQLEMAETNIFNLSTANENNGNNMISLDSATQSTLSYVKGLMESGATHSGIPTKLKDLDNVIGGLHPSDLIIIAARPGMGKTTLAMNIAWNIAQSVSNKKLSESLSGPVLFFSLEMSHEQLAARFISSATNHQLSTILSPQISKDVFEEIQEKSRELSRIPMYIDDSALITVNTIRSRARRIMQQHKKLSAIVIDYLQLITPMNLKVENRTLEISEMTRNLKILAKELNVPIILLSQLSRQVENRSEQTPQLSDLRESGSIEQDADLVLFIYREEYYLKMKKNVDQEKLDMVQNQATLIISKNRHGPTKSVKVHYKPETFTFSNLSNDDY
ncbi:MAG: replicative DNA helicase [Alphaproteobacteria bacterium]|nr:replicative DNA helicase [Alphaproteobacteria bacterium]MBL0718073.1 replicative DNA helicase [Alphaproteobacteria bacterium]